MIEVTQGGSVDAPVYLADAAGAPKTGVLYTQVTVRTKKQGAAAGVRAVASNEWVEVDQVNLPGHYTLKLGAADSDAEGPLLYFVSGASFATYSGAIFVKPARATSAQAASILADVSRLLGLNLFNARLRDQTYNSQNRRLTGKIYQYDSKANADLDDGATGLVRTMDLALSWDSAGRNLTSKVTE